VLIRADGIIAMHIDNRVIIRMTAAQVVATRLPETANLTSPRRIFVHGAVRQKTITLN
jgi:hypothetical protein